MAERPSVESVLSRIDDLGGRIATAKNLSDVQESIGRLATQKQVIEVGETMTKILAEVKGLRTEMADLREGVEKAVRKLREEFLEAIENIDVGGGEESAEAIEKTVEKYLGELKGLAKYVIGDDPETVSALRGRVRDWIGKGKGKSGGGAIGPGDVD